MKLKSKRAHGKNERVIYLWSIPANGHLNPTLCFTNQLLLRLDELNVSRIVFYSGRAFRDLILNLPNNVDKRRIEFRDYGLEQHTGTDDLLKILMNFDTRPGTLFRVFQCFENSVKLGSKHLFKNLIRDIHVDKPVLILYDQALFFPKLALDLYAKKYNCPKPLHACYVTTFMCAKGVYPYWSELEKMGLLGNNLHLHNKIRTFMITMYDFCKYVFTYYKTLWWDLGFTLVDLFLKCDLPISKYHLIDENLNMVFVLPEVQPRLEFFRKDNIKFVGPSVDESVRKIILNQKVDMEKYVAIIDKYLEKNLLKDINDNESMLSEYLSSAGLSRPGPIASATNPNLSDSLAAGNTTIATTNGGVVSTEESTTNIPPHGLNQSFSFQNEDDFHKSILQRAESTGENFKKLFKPIIYVSMGTVFNNENSHLFTILVEACECFTDKYAVIVSTGDEKTLQKYANTPVHSRGNILMVPHTPQVEILKRAHLFITHAGMNSVSEAVNYGVPIICLPLSGDQPFVAWRVADELRLGIRLQPDASLNVELVKTTIETILSDPSYRQRAQEYSNISKTYAGHKTACDITVQFVKENELREYKSMLSASPKHRRRQKNNAANATTANNNNNTTATASLLPQSDQHAHLLDNEAAANATDKDEVTVVIKSKKKNSLFGGFGSKKK